MNLTLIMKKILNKTLMFNTNKIDEEIIMDMMIDTLNNKTNDEFYIEHPVDSNYFTSKRVEGRYEISTKSNKYFHEPKNWPK